MSSTCRVSGSVARSATRFELAASTHCRSSRKRVSGWSGRAKAQANWRTTMRSRFSASPSGNSGGCGLRADDQLELGQDVDDQPAVRPQRVEDAAPPRRDLIGALGEDVEHELTERADDREVGDVALAPLELRRQEEPLPSDDRPAQLVHHRGLSDAGRARDQHELGLPRRDHALEGLPQGGALRFAPVHGLRNQEAIGGVLRAERERRDVARLAPLPETPLEIALQAGRALIPVVGDLGEQLENDLRQHGRQRVAEPRRGRRLPGHVTVHPADRVAGREREPAGEQLIVGDAERVQIGSTVDGAVHAPGLLGRDIREGLLQQALRARGGLLPRDPRGGAEVGDLDPAGLGIEEDAARVEVLVNEPAAVDVPDRGRHRDREREKVLDRERRRDEPIQRLAHEVFQLQRRSTVERRQRQRLDGWQAMQRRPEIQLVFEPVYLPGEGVISVEHPEDDLVAVRLSHRPVNTRSSPLMKLLTESISLGALFHSPPRSGSLCSRRRGHFHRAPGGRPCGRPPFSPPGKHSLFAPDEASHREHISGCSLPFATRSGTTPFSPSH